MGRARVIVDGVMTANQYRRLHDWVGKQLGRPKECENCGITDGELLYAWANLSGEYRKDVSDWARLCPQCHALIDSFAPKDFKTMWKNRTHCARGHEITPETTYIRPTGDHVCRLCREEHKKALRARRRQEQSNER